MNRRNAGGVWACASRGGGLVVAAGAMLAGPARAAPIAISSGTIYSENFNALAVSGTANDVATLPPGFAFSEAGTGANSTYAANDGSIGTPNTYSFGTGTNTDRALGEITGALQSIFGASFINQTGATVAWITVAYTGEEWRLGDAAAPVDKLDFQLSTTATAVNSGTYADVNGLDFSSPNNSAGSAGPLNGNSSANRTVIDPVTFAPIGGVAPGGVFFIRWIPLNAAGNNDGLAIDDFRISVSSNPIPGDANYSGRVDFADLAILAQHYNLTTGQTWSTGDFTADAAVDFADLVILAQHYGDGVAIVPDAPPTFAADWALAQSLVPEPSVVMFVALGGVGLLRRR